ncbi:MAG TPA: aldo/keto reductase [Tepidisphaeraceae bacterium]|jgi:aryl-alcohol dehydrogenase-like predicted oxidoreductase
MKYRRLGKTNLRVSVIGVGTWQFGGEWGKVFSQDEADAMLRRAKEVGINLIDTAECYGNHTSEALIGNAIKSDRKDWIVATKFGHVFHENFKRTDERTAADAVKQLEGSLKALKTDYVDILQYHSIRNEEFDSQELQQTLIRLKQQGKVRHIGSSISPNDNLHQTDGAGPAQVQTIQVVYNRLDRKPEERVLPSCIRQDLGVLARVPLASGFLSGKYKPGTKFPAGDVRAVWKAKDEEQRLQEVQQIAQTEVPKGVPMARWALAWCLQHDAVTCVIPGCKSVEQVEENARAADLEMVKADHPQAWK